MDIKTCPKCGSASTSLVDIDAGMKLLLQKNSSLANLPSKVCSTCYGALTGDVSQGVKLRIEQQAKEKNRHLAWKSRVNLIRHARQLMAQKAYSEAAVSYEKYIRVLELAYDLKPGTLNPSVFGKSSRSKELTVIATTYWDLLRIYDTHPRYRERMAQAARKLSEFLPFSPIFPDVIKKAQSFVSSAKNPDIVKELLRLCKVTGGRCFIATAAFDYPNHPVVLDLRFFRDTHLVRTRSGRIFVKLYNFASPPLADFVRRHPICKPPIRLSLRLMTFFLTPLVHSKET